MSNLFNFLPDTSKLNKATIMKDVGLASNIQVNVFYDDDGYVLTEFEIYASLKDGISYRECRGYRLEDNLYTGKKFVAEYKKHRIIETNGEESSESEFCTIITKVISDKNYRVITYGENAETKVISFDGSPPEPLKITDLTRTKQEITINWNNVVATSIPTGTLLLLKNSKGEIRFGFLHPITLQFYHCKHLKEKFSSELIPVAEHATEVVAWAKLDFMAEV